MTDERHPGSLMNALIAMEHFQSTFDTGTTGTKIGIMTSLYTV